MNTPDPTELAGFSNARRLEKVGNVRLDRLHYVRLLQAGDCEVYLSGLLRYEFLDRSMMASTLLFNNSTHEHRTPGGSAANVAKGIAHLCPSDTRVRFVSMVGADAAGEEFRQGLAAAGVEPLLLESPTGLPTSTCLCMVRSVVFDPFVSQMVFFSLILIFSWRLLLSFWKLHGTMVDSIQANLSMSKI